MKTIKGDIMKWLKRIKNKGFTLIELLAVIVILAIILVIVVPKVFNTIDSSKIKALESSAKSLASSWEKEIISSQLSDESHLEAVIEEPRCITSDEADYLGISKKEYLIIEDLDNCSKVKKSSNGKIIVWLYANPEGSIYTSTATITKDGTGPMYAASSGEDSKSEQDTYNETHTATSLGLSKEDYVFEIPIRDVDITEEIISKNTKIQATFMRINRAFKPNVSSVRLYSGEIQTILVSKKTTSLGRLYVMSNEETGYVSGNINDEENVISAT